MVGVGYVFLIWPIADTLDFKILWEHGVLDRLEMIVHWTGS